MFKVQLFTTVNGVKCSRWIGSPVHTRKAARHVCKHVVLDKFEYLHIIHPNGDAELFEKGDL